MMKPCSTCGLPAEKNCSNCQIVSYCSVEHQWNDWKNHKKLCSTVKQEKDEVQGRYLVTVKDLEAGELIFEDPPLVIGPAAISELTCLGCHTLIKSQNFYSCDSCYWPLCSSECSKRQFHLQECKILRKDKKKCAVPQVFEETPRYDIILILRCLLMKRHNIKNWMILKSMEGHVDFRKKESDQYHLAAIRYFTEVLKEENFELEDVHFVRGAILSNCYESKHSSGAILRGLYPTLGLINHSCLPNVTIREDIHGKMFVRSIINIEKGEKLSISYSQIATPTWERWNYTKTVHYFRCNCLRCNSPTELGTFFSTLMCPLCYRKPLSYHQDFSSLTCQNCLFKIKTEEMAASIESQISLIHNGTFYEPKTLENIKRKLMSLEKVYHKTQYLWVKASHEAIYLLTSLPLSEDVLEMKISLWKNLLEVYDSLEPGMTRRRAMMLFELGTLGSYLAEKTVFEDQSSKTENYLQNLKYLKEAEEILKLEPMESVSFKWYENVKRIIFDLESRVA